MASGAGPGAGGGAGCATTAPSSGDQRAVEQWLRFALAQEARVAPHADPASLQTTGSRGAYRLALDHLDGLPLFATDDRCFNVRLGVSLWDRGAGCFFGNTAHSAPVSYDMRRSKGKRGFHLDLDYTLYLHTRARLGGHCAAQGSSGGSSSMGVGTGGTAAAMAGSGGGLAAIVEVVLVEHGEEGVTLNEFSAGWAMVPLSAGGDGDGGGGSGGDLHPQAAGPGALVPGSPGKVALGIAASSKPATAAGSTRATLRLGSCLGCTAAPGSPAQAGGALSPLLSGALASRLGAGGSMSVPVFVGSPRWLVLHQATPPGRCPAPPQLLADGAECRLHFQFAPSPEAEAWGPLVPDNFLLSSRDVVPGMQRLRAGADSGSGAPAGSPAPTLAFLSTASQLEPPHLRAMHAVVLSGLRLHLPNGFVEVARQHAATVWRGAHADGGLGAAAGAGLLQRSDLQQRLLLRVSVHNGRRFVGPPALCQAAALEPMQGRRGEHELLLAEPAPLAWLPADRHVVLVLELLLHTEPPPSGRGGPAGTGTSSAGLEGAAGLAVLAWTAVSPFTWQTGGLEAAVAAGQHQAALRSGPGRWLRHAPVLDWRRLLERTNRLSPEAPTVRFWLAEAPWQAVWPPPPALVALQAVPRVSHPHAGRAGRLAQLSTAASEAETLVNLAAAPAQQKRPAPAPATLNLAMLAGSKPTAAPAAVQAWHISAHYDAAASGASEVPPQQQEQRPLPVLPSIRTRPLPLPPTEKAGGTAAAALYAGSPTKARPAPAGQLGGGSSSSGMPTSVLEAATAAQPAEALVQRRICLSTELDDQLISTEVTLQFIALDAEPDQGGSCCCGSGSSHTAQHPLPSRLHFTFCSPAGPAVTAPLRLERVSHAASPGPGGPQLLALVPDDVGRSGGAGDDAYDAPVHCLRLLDEASLLPRGLSAEGLPPAAAASLARQHRLLVARWLAQGRLQVDVWDSASLLQVGTLSLPLHGLLRQQQPYAELLLRVPVGDPNRAICRLDPGGRPAQLCCSPIRGSLIVRLACTGSQPDLQTAWAGQPPAGSRGWPASPLKQHGAGDGTLVVRAKPALEEAGQLALELARLEGVPEGTAPDRLAQEVVGRAAAKVQRLLHYRSLPGAARRCSGSAACAEPASATVRGGTGSGDGSVAVRPETGPEQGPAVVGASEAGLMLERRLLTEVEAARERMKRDAILARLQAELPSCQALCIAPGQATGFELAFVNNSSSAGWFEVGLDTGSGSSGVAALTTVSGQAEWHSLELDARLAGLCQVDDPRQGSGHLRAVYSSRFQLAAHERCLVRLKLSCSLQAEQAPRSGAGQGGLMSWHKVAIRPAGGSSRLQAAADGSVPAAATVRVGVQQLPAPPVDRTFRIYCPTGGSGPGNLTAVVHAVDLAQLPGGERLFVGEQPMTFACSSPAVSTALEGSRLVLSCAGAEPGTTQRFLVAALSPGSSRTAGGGATMACCPAETWEVFLHTLPAVRLAASLGAAATASCLVSQDTAVGNPGSQAHGLAFSWRGCCAAELAASLGSGPSTAASAAGRSSRLVLSFEPAAPSRHELLLSVVSGGGSQPPVQGGKVGQPGAAVLQGDQEPAAGRPQQVELLLVQLDSSGTCFSRTFEVDVPAGQSVSKKVRYTNPHLQARRFAVHTLRPELLRPAHKWQRAAGGVLLQAGEEASIRLSFGGAAAPPHSGSSGVAGQQRELVAVLESAETSGGGPWQVEEVFRVLLHAA